MIEAEIHCNDKLLMQRNYHDHDLSLESVVKQLEMYVLNEQLNTAGECLIRVRFSNPIGTIKE